MNRILLLLLAAATIASAAGDISGKWSGFPVYITFKQDGNKLTGTAGQGESDQIPFQDGVIENDHITFKLGGMEADLHLAGEQISGEIRNGTNSMKLVLRRVKVRDPSAPPLTFEAATVKRAAPTPMGKGMGSSMRAAPGRITGDNVTLKTLIVRAWKLKGYQVTGPEWLNDERYDLVATMPAGSSPDDVFAMLQSLLTDRFGLRVHNEMKELPVYGLMVDKNNFKLPPGGALGNTSISGGPKGRSLTADTTMTHLAETLSDQVDRPVIDMTEMKESFHIAFQWTPDENPSNSGDTTADSTIGASIFMALHDIGLKLQPHKAPVEILVVDHAEKIPAAN